MKTPPVNPQAQQLYQPSLFFILALDSPTGPLKTLLGLKDRPMHLGSQQTDRSRNNFFSRKCPTEHTTPTKSLPLQLAMQIKARGYPLMVWDLARSRCSHFSPAPRPSGKKTAACFLYLSDNSLFLSLHQHTGFLRYNLSKSCPVKTPKAIWGLLLSSHEKTSHTEQPNPEVSLRDRKDYIKITLF